MQTLEEILLERIDGNRQRVADLCGEVRLALRRRLPILFKKYPYMNKVRVLAAPYEDGGYSVVEVDFEQWFDRPITSDEANEIISDLFDWDGVFERWASSSNPSAFHEVFGINSTVEFDRNLNVKLSH